MKNRTFFLILVLIFIAPFFSLFHPNQTQGSDFGLTSKSKRIVVKFKQTVPESVRRTFRTAVTSHDTIRRLNTDIFEGDENKIESLVKSLKSNRYVEYVEEDYIAYALEETNDPNLHNQWGVYKINASGDGLSAWNYTKGSPNLSIAIVDSGIDFNHEEFQGKIVGTKNCSNSRTSDDLYGHGTHVAGIIAATSNNSKGIAGVAPEVKLLNAKALGDSGSGYYSWIANCILWSVDSGAKVINLSLGGTSKLKVLEDAISYALGKGVVVVAAAGNSNNSNIFYPAGYENVISVGATDSNDQKASFSNFGLWVDVAAPGVSIYSTLPNHTNSLKTKNYGYLSGTSMSTPHVSGVAALIISVGLTDNNLVAETLFNSADTIPQTGLYWKYGRLNALRAVQLALNEGAIILTITPTISPASFPTATITPTTSVPTVTLSPTPTMNVPVTISPTPFPSPTNYWSKLCQKHPIFCQ